MTFYVYKWYVKSTGEIFYVGKGCNKRYTQIRKRNKIFQEYLNKFVCDSAIIKTFDNEISAFEFEHTLITELKSKGLCKANLDNGGNGGVNFIWTKELRDYKSIYNPMKQETQRTRMKNNNPMKDPVTRQKVIDKKQKTIIYGDKEYISAKHLSEDVGLGTTAIYYWISRGYGKNNLPCYYKQDGYKPYTIKTHETSNKPVIIDGKWFKNVKAGAKHIGVWSENLIKSIKNNKKCKGHTCEYANQQPSLTNFDKSSEEGSTTNG